MRIERRFIKQMLVFAVVLAIAGLGKWGGWW